MIRRKSNGNREKQRFSIKKISGKTASVLIGFTIFGGLLIEIPKAKADTNTSYNSAITSTTSSTDTSVEKTTSDTNTSENGGKADVNSTQTDSTASTVTPVGSTADKETTNTSETNSTSQINSTNQADSVANLSTSTNSEVGSEAVTTSQASSETTVTSEVTSTAPTTAPTNSAPVRVRRAVTTNLATANYEDRDSGTVTSPTKVGADGISKVQIGGTAPTAPSGSSLVTMKIKFQSYQTPIMVQNLPITIRGVEEGGNGVMVFDTGISNIDLTTQGVEYTVYIVSKSTNKPYLLTNDNVVLKRDGLDTNFVTYVKSKVTDEKKMTSNIVIEVAESPQLTEEAKQGLVIRKSGKSAINPLKARDYIANGKSIPNYNELLPSFVGLDTKTPGKQDVKIAVQYPGGSTSWTYGNNINYNSETFIVEVTDADKLNNSIQTVAPTKSTDNYKFAEQDKKDAYDAAVKNATSVFTNQKSTQAQIDAATKQLTSAKEQLNGDEKKKALDTAKDEANKAINALENLNDAQKQGALAAVTAATTVDEVTTAKNTATGLDQDMGQLKDEVADDSDLRDSVNYKNADQEKQAAYDEAVSAAKAILAKDGKNEASPEVKNAQAAVKAAKEALNGDTKLATAKDEANKAINALENLNDAQKQGALAAVTAATTVDEVTTAKNTATGLDQDMGQLKDEVADDSDLRDSVNYKNADQEKQAAYDEAVSAAKAILAKDGKNEASPEVKNAQAAVKAAKEALNGDTKLATAKDEANKAIEAMPNLSKEDKSKAETAVNNATDNAGVDTAKANAQALPQTGDEDNSTLSLLGVVLLTIASVLSFSGVRKKENK
ncbi:hypothetical protein CP353_09875 [Lactobacillus sp. UMNPBX2]|nr:hypothetical protein CP353_09875 [Lactobacillus sp. UMNPBX2]